MHSIGTPHQGWFVKLATPGLALIYLCLTYFSSSTTDIRLLLLSLDNNCNYCPRWKRRGESNKYRAEEHYIRKKLNTPNRITVSLSVTSGTEDRDFLDWGSVGWEDSARDSKTERQSPPKFLERTRKLSSVPEGELLTYFRSL